MGRAFEYRKHKKFARWSAMSKNFTKLSKIITMAVKAGGPDPISNYRLKIAIQNAKGFQMPKDNIEAAIKKASSKESENFQELSYEGYGPHSVAVWVDSATDNPNRTVSNLRTIFSKSGGELGQTGSLTYLFSRKSMFKFPATNIDLEELELYLIDYGLEEITKDEEEITVVADFTDFSNINKALEEKGIETTEAKTIQMPTVFKEITDEQFEDVIKLLEKLEDDDDVQAVYINVKD